MKYLKLFNQQNEYLDIAEYLDAPNVSYVIETDTVYYHPFVETMIVATYNVSYSGEEVKLLNGNYTGGGFYGDPVYTFDINKIEEMYVDGVKLSEPVRTYNFNEVGEHVVKYKFYDIENALAADDYQKAPFYDCDNLTSVTIPGSVTSIGRKAFSGCSSLTSVTIPDSVTNIGYEAFHGCTSLISVTIPDSVTLLGDNAFSYCKLLTSVTIPDSITSIGGWTFSECRSLTKVIIGNSVTEIDSDAFAYCTSLTSVYCKPTTPPALYNSNVFKDNASGRKFYVPMESVDAYKTAPGWSEYASDIEGYNF